MPISQASAQETNLFATNQAKSTILVLVNATIYPQIVGQLSIFEQDLESEGYNTLVQSVNNGLTPPEIKGIIKTNYVENSISGCILIGDIKAAYTEIRTGDYSNQSAQKVWISLDAADMYYMDLDGHWENITHPDLYAHKPSNVVEVHLYDSCQTFYNEYIVYPDETKKWDYFSIEHKEQYKAEIWVSRIMTHNLKIPGYNEAQLINSFLNWDHVYRTNIKQVSDQCYLLSAIAPDYEFQGMEFSRIFDNTVKVVNATKQNYVSCLANPNGSELTYLLAHSYPQGHAMYDITLTVDELASCNKTSVFYILNACSACRWDQAVTSPASPNYLGGIYVFDKDEEDYGLGAIGFTGVGGFNWLECFSDYLDTRPNPTYGEAYKYWFNENLMHIFGTNNYVYLGDPTIGPRDVEPLRWAGLEWETMRGDWIVSDGELSQTSTGLVSWIFAGNASWRDYDLETDVKFIEGSPEASVGFRSPDENNVYYFCLAGGAKVLTLAKIAQGIETYNVQSKPWSNPQYDTWYHVKIEVRNDRIKAYLDSVLIFDYVAPDLTTLGRIGLRTYYTRASFSNLTMNLIEDGSTLVTDLNFDGAVNILDIAIVGAAYNTEPGDPKWNELADLDKNGTVNILDISAVAKDFGKTV
jgi:hypothetical protein